MQDFNTKKRQAKIKDYQSELFCQVIDRIVETKEIPEKLIKEIYNEK